MLSYPHEDKWVVFSSIYFGVLGYLSLLVTDLILLPSNTHEQSMNLFFAKEPLLIASTSLPPALFAYIAAKKWLHDDSKFFRGWLSVACFSWLSLVINPLIWFLVMVTYMGYGAIVLGVLFIGGFVLQVFWQVFRISK